MAELSGVRVRGRPRLGWMNGVKVALGSRGKTVEAGQQCVKDRKEWRALVAGAYVDDRVSSGHLWLVESELCAAINLPLCGV